MMGVEGRQVDIHLTTTRDRYLDEEIHQEIAEKAKVTALEK